jgi:NADH-quinone oxidoreductase subunit H
MLASIFNTYYSLLFPYLALLFGLVILLISVAYYTYLERKLLAWMQARLGPTEVGYAGLLQPIADSIKLLAKHLVIPAKAERWCFLIAPLLVMLPAFMAWAVIPVGNPAWVWSDLTLGLLYLLMVNAIEIYGLVLAGWASHSRYAFLGAMRAAAQFLSYELVLSFTLLGPVLLAGSMHLPAIVTAQAGGCLQWYVVKLFPLFCIFALCAVAATNRAPFDVAEGESEIVAGFHVEYAGISFALFFLAEYANMILAAALASLLFLGGWLPIWGSSSPLWGWLWLLAKMLICMLGFIWVRATFPRYRYDQIMQLCWQYLLPITLVIILIVAMLVGCIC